MSDTESPVARILDYDEHELEKRERKQTERGLSYQIELLSHKRQIAGQRLSREIRTTYELLENNVDLRALENQRDKLDTVKEEFTTAHISYDNILSEDSEVKKSSYSWFDIRDREYFECRVKLSEMIKSLEAVFSDRESNYSRRSSYRSRGSSESTRSLLLKASVTSAKLRAQMKYHKRESELKHLSLMKEIEIAEAEERAIKNFLAEEDSETKSTTSPLLSDSASEIEQNRNQLNTTQLPPKVKIEKPLTADDDRSLIDQFPDTNPPQIDETPKRPIPKKRNRTPRIKEEDFKGNEDILSNPVTTSPENHSLENETLKHLIQLQTKQTELSTLLVTQHSVNQLPTKEPPTFDGNPFDYPAFITAFDTIISSNVNKDNDRLYYLEKYTRGKANEVVKGFLSVASEDSYSQARKLLDERFGNPVYVAEAYKLSMRNWPNISEGNSKALQEFSDFLIRCVEAIKSIGSPSELDSTETLITMSAKLPSYSGVKWCRHAHEMRLKMKRVTFSDFVTFVRNEADLANDPIFSPDALKRERKKATEREYKPRPKRTEPSSAVRASLATNISSAPSKSPGSKPSSCPACDKDHNLEKCYTFKAKSADYKRDLIVSKGLCFGCLKPGHRSSSCQDRLKCDECGKPHPTSLHGVKPKPKPRTSQRYGNNAGSNAITVTPVEEVATSDVSVCNSVECNDQVTTSLIVPILLSHKDHPNQKVRVYALLDDGSDATFVRTSILKQLGIEGPEITLKLNTMHGQQQITVSKIEGLIAEPMSNVGSPIDLPKAYTSDLIPSFKGQIPTPDVARKWSHLYRIKDQLLPIQDDMVVGVLIGCNCPKALKPRDVIPGGEDDPYAIKTSLGWGILGPANLPEHDNGFTCHRIVAASDGSNRSVKFVTKEQTKEIIDPEVIKAMFQQDFSEKECGDAALSLEDRKFLEIVKGGIRQLPNGHYELPLPIRNDLLKLPNNHTMAYNRLRSLRKRFSSDKTYLKHYIEFMNAMLEKGYAEPAQQVDSEQNVWYIPHHGVYHPKKPNKVRVVFDCSAQYGGESLNKNLLQGPDLTNNLTGVLQRFRKEPIAIMCDIEAMFYQVQVPEDHRDLLRFLWWEDGDTSKEAKEYRMTVHLFGAASSPGCSNFALKSTADDGEAIVGREAAEFVRRNFYVDDGLTSVSTVNKAIKLVTDVKELCRRGGFNLTKFTSNSKEVIRHIPETDRAEDVKQLKLNNGAQTSERALGVLWCRETDVFKFMIALKERPCTRRGILSTVSSIFDPLGFLAPVMLEGKSMLQDLCCLSIGWDDPVPQETQVRWRDWKTRLQQLETLAVPRCYKPEGFGTVEKAELHNFSDASFKGYSQCSYLRLVNAEGRIHCCFLTGKSRVTPLKKITVPRLELTAAVVSVRVSEQLKRELDMEISNEVFWTDSKVVLGYIANEVRRFHVFVANRVQEIQEKSSVKQWRYVDTKSNPADEGSRGLKADQLHGSKWLSGPDFLWKADVSQNDPKTQIYELPSDDPEIKKSVSMATNTHAIQPQEASLEDNLKHLSSWFRAKRAVALCVKFAERLKDRTKRAKPVEVRASDLEDAKLRIIRATQATFYKDDICAIQKAQQEDDARYNKDSTAGLQKLNPFVDSHGLLRVGGRLRHSSLPESIKYPVILPAKGHITSLIILHFHERLKHQGRSFTLSELRGNGYWIIGGTKAVGSLIERCVICNKLRAKVQDQKMADLPEDRLQIAPPFTNCAVDYFGPFLIKERRKEIKRYGVLFTCLSSRAIHLEVANTLETDSFINAFRRFVSRRGPINLLRCDQGTNFVGARRELAQALKEMDQEKIKNELLKTDCDYFAFKMNVPGASHMGGVWERQIRTVRNVLSAILQDNSTQLNDESLRTFMCEVEAIVNCRPLTVEGLNDPDALIPLSASQLLTMKTKVLMAPPGVFQPADQYSRKWWRRVQHLVNEFWTRWRKEFLLTLQTRQKWTRSRRDVQVNDIVIIKDDNLPRSSWPLGRIQRVNQSSDGRVRSALVYLAEKDLDSIGKRQSAPRFLERPIRKLVVLMKADENTQTG